MWIFLFLLSGFLLLVLGAELLVRGSCQLAALLGMTPLLIGLTIVAFGTSSPELAISIQSIYSKSSSLAVGNAVGSNTLNTLLILGLSAIFVPLVVRRDIVKLEVPVVIVATIALWLVSIDGVISRWDGVGFVIFLAGFIGYKFLAARRKPLDKDHAPLPADLPKPVGGLPRSGRKHPSRVKMGLLSLAMVVIGILCLAIGCRLFVEGSVQLARLLGMSELVIGLTVVALGTSLPELATVIVATISGAREMAVGSILGSNLFNILAVLGISSIVAPAGIEVPWEALQVDIPVALLAIVLCVPIFLIGGAISRRDGALMVILYAAYVIYLVAFGSATEVEVDANSFAMLK